MKKIFLLLLIMVPLTSIAQLTFELKGLVNKKISSDINEGSNIELKEIIKNNKGEKAVVIVNGEEHSINLRNFDKITFTPSTSKQFWQNQMIEHSVYESILKNGLQYKLRKNMEEEAIKYINYLNDNNQIFKDNFLENYLYSLVYRIYPDKLDDGRPGILNVKIVKDIAPNAGIYSNGTMIVTTGLLSTINSEEELVGILAHEISHFVLDHSVMNINKVEKRKKRAEFWAAFATGVAAVADVYASKNSKNSYYIPGTITASTAVLSYSIASMVKERMGLKFSREQEMEADRSAVKLMKHINVNPTALSSALRKIKKYCTLTGNYLALTGTGTHPAIDDRISEIGEPTIFKDVRYDLRISFVNSFNALIELNNQHFLASSNLATRNIQANVATEQDYILKAMTLLYMYDNQNKNNEALNLINKAKALNVLPNINIHKQEALILIRLDRVNQAKSSLLAYLKELEKLNAKSTEYEWTRKMIYKVGKL